MPHSARETTVSVDCLILGGGITGAGIARDATIRGLRTLLLDDSDFAGGTSHVTSKLIHGGLRYLEHGHVRLVWEGLVERNRLQHRLAPHLLRPIRFAVPFSVDRWPKWLATALVLPLYDLVGGALPGTCSRPMLGGTLARTCPLLESFPLAVTFCDAQVHDARLVMATLRTAEHRGAALMNYTQVVSSRHDASGWHLISYRSATRRTISVHARCVVNATGPWSPATAELLGRPAAPLKWLKGSHVVLHLPDGFGDAAVIFPSIRDRRPLWAIPWLGRLLLGTTERELGGLPRLVEPSRDEIDELLRSFGRAFPRLPARLLDPIGAFAGVRPIADTVDARPNGLSRRHRIDEDRGTHLVTVAGGKLTTFRLAAEEAGDAVDRVLSITPRPFPLRRRLRSEPLWPGLGATAHRRTRKQLSAHPARQLVSDQQFDHLVSCYGTDAARILEDIALRPDGSAPLIGGLPHGLAELRYLCRTEWVMHLTDLLDRRTPFLQLAESECRRLAEPIADRIAPVLGWSASRVAEEIAPYASPPALHGDRAVALRSGTHSPAISLSASG